MSKRGMNILVERKLLPVLTEVEDTDEDVDGKADNYSDLHIFRSPVYIMYNSKETTKLDSKSRKCLFFGYVDRVKGYHLWDPIAHKVVASRDFVLMEYKIQENSSRVLESCSRLEKGTILDNMLLCTEYEIHPILRISDESALVVEIKFTWSLGFGLVEPVEARISLIMFVFSSCLFVDSAMNLVSDSFNVYLQSGYEEFLLLRWLRRDFHQVLARNCSSPLFSLPYEQLQLRTWEKLEALLDLE
nr:Gag-Pol polyprotein [Tanacetum cinerariifolium]